MGKRKETNAKKKKLEVKKETLRTMDLSDDQLKQVAGGLMTTEPPHTCPSRVC